MLSPVQYAKFQSIRYFIDIDILKKVHIDIDIDIDIFKNDHVNIDIDINIFQIVLININTDINIFKISLSIFLLIFIFLKYSYQYFDDIDISSKKHEKVSNLLKTFIFLPKMSFKISISISSKIPS